MSEQKTEPVEEDSVPKVNDDIAVGEDLEFQRRWWRFERSVWILFAFILLLNIAGVFDDQPVNTDMPLSVITSYSTLKTIRDYGWDKDWGSLSSNNQVMILRPAPDDTRRIAAGDRA